MSLTFTYLHILPHFSVRDIFAWFYYFNIFMLIFIFLLALENDLGEVETSWLFIVKFYNEIILSIKPIKFMPINKQKSPALQPKTSQLNQPISSSGPDLSHHRLITTFSWLWRRLPLRLSKCQSPRTVLFRTTLTRTIILYQLLILLGSNHLLQRNKPAISCFDKSHESAWKYASTAFRQCNKRWTNKGTSVTIITSRFTVQHGLLNLSAGRQKISLCLKTLFIWLCHFEDI